MNHAPTAHLHADKKKILLSGYFIRFLREHKVGNPIQPRKALPAIDPPQGIRLQSIGDVFRDDLYAEP